MSLPADIEAKLKCLLRDAGLTGLSAGGEQLTTLQRLKGAYVLALCLKAPVGIVLRGRNHDQLEPGWYFYLGSAWGSGGIAARLKRHFQKQKTIRWHIDRLTVEAADMAAIAVPDGRECNLVELLLAAGGFKTAVPGFGSTDCDRCAGHLLAIVQEPEKKERGTRPCRAGN